MQELEWEYRQKEAQLERDISERIMERENGLVLQLKQQQIAEKREVFE